MPSSLALGLCISFVLLLLRLERRASRDISWAVWIPTLWLMIMASRPLGIWLNAGQMGLEGGNESGSVVDRWSLTTLAIAAVIVFVRRRFDWRTSLRRHKWLVFLFVYMLASTFWSDFTLIALRRWVREIIILPMAFLLMSEYNPRHALASMLRRTAYILVPFSVLLIKYYPALGRVYGRYSGVEMWTGVTGQKNHLGRLCLISIFFLLLALYKRWRERSRTSRNRYQAWADGFVIVLSLYLLKGSDSSTSQVTLLLGLTSFFGLQLLRRLSLPVPQFGLIGVVIFFMAFGVATPFMGGANVAGLSSSLGRDSTLTGRTEVWDDVLPARQERPLLGYGLGSFWTDARRKFYDIPTSHNGYLDILLELGEVGLPLYAVWLLASALRLRRALPQDYEWANFAICLLVMGLVYNISESALNSFTEEMTTVVALAALIVPHESVLPLGRRTSENIISSAGLPAGFDLHQEDSELSAANRWA